MPLESDEYRCTPDGQCIVWKTEDAGATWTALTKGLPQRDAHLTVLRDGFSTDGSDPAGLYFGTRTGEVYASTDDGDSWRELAVAPAAGDVGPRGSDPMSAMDVRLRLPTQLRDLAQGESVVVVSVDGGVVTVQTVLDSLALSHPALERRVRDERGKPVST